MSDINNTTSDTTLYDEAGNPVKIILNGGDYKLVVYNPDIVSGNQKVIIWDGIDTADVTPTGRLQVDTGSPVAPPSTTPIKQEEYSDVAVSDDNIFVIPDTETLQITRFSAGAESTNGGNVIELWYDPLGTGSGMIIIDVIFADGASYQHDINFTVIGDGTKQIRMIRRRLSGGSNSIYASWEGYY